MKITLASSSPRRRELLEKLGLTIEFASADIDETMYPQETPYVYVERLGIAKGQKIADYTPGVVIAGDTTVELAGRSIGKAADSAEAATTLRELRGQQHFVRTGYAIFSDGKLFNSGVVSTAVKFRDFSNSELENYLQSGQWQGKAGAYGAQDETFHPVATLQGSYFNVLGLPLLTIATQLRELGIEIGAEKLSAAAAADRLPIV